MDDGSSPLWGCIIFLIFIVFNGILYGFGAAIQNVRENEIERLAEEGDKKSILLQKMLEKPARLVQTIQIVATLLSILTGYVGIRYFVHIVQAWLANFSVFSQTLKSWTLLVSVIAVLLVTLILLLGIGIFAPKKICRHHAQSSVYLLLKPVYMMTIIFLPLTVLIGKFSNLIVRICGIDPYAKSDVTEEEIINMVDEAHEQGVIMESEAAMIQNIIQFSDKDAKDIMTHRMNIIGLDANMSLDEAIKIMVDESNSRYPVYVDDIDNIIGIVHLKDAMKQVTYYHNGKTALKDIPTLIRTVGFIPETRSIDAIFKAMQVKKVHMAIVVDEYGQTSGLVAMEDILEEIVGNILDEYDEDDNFIQHQYDNSIIMEGLTPLEQVALVLHVEFDDEFETLNGYLTALLDHIPTSRDHYVDGKGFRFEILKVENNIIQKVKVKKLIEGEEKCQDIQNLRI